MSDIIKTSSIMEAMQKAIDETPEDKRGSLKVNMYNTGANASFTYRYKDVEAGGYVSKTWTGKVEGGGLIRWEF